MDQTVISWLLSVLTAATTGLIVWIAYLQVRQTNQEKDLTAKINALELRLANGYHNKDELRQTLVEVLTPIRDDLKTLKERSDRERTAR